jgi:glycosyltransferase involved in cell wall biosynthesis
MIAKLAEKKSFLMVGTVEPRKGHAQALDAFEILWREGTNVCLVIIGKQGWSVEPLSEKLRTHPQLGKTLFWLESASDDALFQIYRRVNALLAASEGEGFGLPLVEAAKASLPIIARNLPVFREVAGDHAFYFDGRSAEDLAADLKQWLKLHEQGEVPSSGPVRCLSWEDSAHMLLEQILDRGVRRPR